MPYRTDAIPEPVTERLYEGHRVWIWKLALSPDGKTLAGGGHSDDSRIHLWDVHTGEVLGTLKGHTDSVIGLAFSTDGRRLYSASYDGSLRSWDVDGKTANESLLVGRSLFNALALSPNGTLAAGGNDGIVYLICASALATSDVTQRGEPAQLTFGSRIRSLAFSADGQTLAVGGSEGKLCVFQRTGDVWHETRSYELSNTVWALAFTPDGKSVVCGTKAGKLHRVGLAHDSSERLTTLESHTRGEIRSLLFADEQTLLVGQWDTSVADGQPGSGRLAVFSWADGELLRGVNDFCGLLDSLVLQGDGRYLLTPKNRTPGLEEPARYAPALHDFGDVHLGRGEEDTLLTVPPWAAM